MKFTLNRYMDESGLVISMRLESPHDADYGIFQLEMLQHFKECNVEHEYTRWVKSAFENRIEADIQNFVELASIKIQAEMRNWVIANQHPDLHKLFAEFDQGHDRYYFDNDNEPAQLQD